MRSHRLMMIAVGLALANVAVTCAAADESMTMFNEQTYRSLVAESKALKVGDLLTVIVQESSTASSTADLQGQRNFKLSANLQLQGIPHRGTEPHSVTAGTGSESNGTAGTQRSGKLLAQLTVRVMQVLANGDLVIAGQQSLRINDEEQLITLSGVVRPRDVIENNTVLSSRIADARIRFDGEGFVTDQSKPSWITKLFNFLGL